MGGSYVLSMAAEMNAIHNAVGDESANKQLSGCRSQLSLQRSIQDPEIVEYDADYIIFLNPGLNLGLRVCKSDLSTTNDASIAPYRSMSYSYQQASYKQSQEHLKRTLDRLSSLTSEESDSLKRVELDD